MRGNIRFRPPSRNQHLQSLFADARSWLARRAFQFTSTNLPVATVPAVASLAR